jgi:hypothetical protein
MINCVGLGLSRNEMLTILRKSGSHWLTLLSAIEQLDS